MRKQKKFGKVSFLMILFAVIASSVILYQIKLYNKSVLNMYAEQQDQYIKLILSQIDLNKEDTENTINKILNSLDASNKKIFTLTKKDSLVYVKDITETDKYKNLFASSYYITKSARNFLNSLEKDKVIHRFINLSDKNYIASGALFKYAGDEYKICLLTNESFILDNNDFIQAEIVIILGIVILLLMLLIVSMSMAHRLDKKQSENDILQERIGNRNKSIEKLEEDLRMANEYDVKNTFFKEKVFGRFMEKLEQRDPESVYLLSVLFDENIKYERFLKSAQLVLGKKVIKFILDDKYEKKGVILVFWNCEADEIKSLLKMLINSSDVKIPIGKWQKSDKGLREYCLKYLDKIREEYLKDDDKAL